MNEWTGRQAGVAAAYVIAAIGTPLLVHSESAHPVVARVVPFGHDVPQRRARRPVWPGRAARAACRLGPSLAGASLLTVHHSSAASRVSLDTARVLVSAIDRADVGGIAALSMRKLGQELGVEAMSLYNHVANKDDLLDGMVDLVFAAIGLPAGAVGWKAAMRQRAISARAVLARYPWAIRLMESRRRPGPATLRHHDAVLGCLRDAGFSIAMAAHAYAVLDSYIDGFALQQASLPFRTSEEVVEEADRNLRQFPTDAYPHLAEMTVQYVLQPGYDFADELELGLDLILDGLDRHRETH